MGSKKWLVCKVCNKKTYTQNKVYCSMSCMSIGYTGNLYGGGPFYNKKHTDEVRNLIKKQVGAKEKNRGWKGGSKVSSKKYYQNNIIKEQKRHKKWHKKNYEENKESVLKKTKEWRAKNKEWIRVYQRKWYWENHEKMIERGREKYNRLYKVEKCI